VKGLSVACRENGCALLGGETAEMPGLYHGDDFDLAGTIVGIVEKKHIIDGSAIRPGDVILGLPSSGLQTNGYSLARRVFFEQLKLKPQSMVPELKSCAGDALLAVHRSFLPALKPWLKHPALKGLAHITGGGFIDNIPRILPEHCRAEIRLNTWPVLPLFQYLEAKGKINQATMFRTFNMGIGFVLVVAARQAQDIMRGLRARKEPVYRIGVIARGPRGVALV
jgi:phosphoribosylformylglycinamidine cyclo-ligase